MPCWSLALTPPTLRAASPQHFVLSLFPPSLLFRGDPSPASQLSLLLWKLLSQMKTSQHGSGIKPRHLHMPLLRGDLGLLARMRLLCCVLLARGTQGAGGMQDGQPGSPSQCLCAGMWVSSQSCSISASSSSSKHSSLPSEVPCTEQQCQQPGERSQGRALGINVQGGQLQEPHLLLGLAASWAPRGD